MIKFKSIPSDIRVPGSYMEIDGSGARGNRKAKQPHRVILVAQRLSSGAVLANVPTRMFGGRDGDAPFGAKSPLAAMVRKYRGVDPRTELWAMALDDHGSGVAASGKIVFGGTATQTGVIPLYVSGERIEVPVVIGDDSEALAAAAEIAFDAAYGLPLVATQSVVSGEEDELLLVASFKGPGGNDIVLEVARETGDKLPAGVTVAITAMASGATPPTVTTAVTALGDVQYNTAAIAPNDYTSVTAFENEFVRRWGPIVGIEGAMFVGVRASHADTVVAGEARNSPFTTLVSNQGATTLGGSPMTPWEMAAITAALDAIETSADPGYPSNGLPMVGAVSPKPNDVMKHEDRRDLLVAGVSTWKLDANGQMVLEKLITTYKRNATNAPDPAYRSLGDVRTLAYLRWNWNGRIRAKYGRHKAASDGTNFEPGLRVVTPTTLRSEALAWFKEMERAAYVEGFEQFAAELQVERDGDDPEQMNAAMFPDLVNQLNIVASSLGFRL